MKKTIYGGLLLAVIAWLSCNKPADGNNGPYKLSYGDSIIYMKPSGSNIVYPLEQRGGLYEGFPDGIEIDDNTGAINVANSETGLRYRITHTATDGTITTTTVILSGITFFDKFYRLSQNDTMALPIYNASEISVLPVTGSVFDDGGTANASGCDIKTVNGQINLAQTVRNGLFGSTPSNDDRRDVDIVYRLNDGSGKALNKLRVRLYYYTSMATIAPDLLETLNDRQAAGVFLQANNSNNTTTAARMGRVAKPRPPCVIIVNQ